MKRRRAPSLRTLFQNRVELEAPAAGAEGQNPRWIQIARTGLWKGYRINRTIEFTKDTFSKIIENFRAHPSYKKGADGVGNVDVIPFDFNHASEMDPAEGDLPVVGAPAQAWVQELELRVASDGKIGLWAFTRLLEPVAGYIKDGKIKWTSVTVWPNAIDPVSGKEVGPLLTSVAFTNQPFIEGMQPIAASYSVGGNWFECATDPEDALRQLRTVFGLPQTIGVGGVLGEIAKFQSWIRAGEVPYGVDADEIIGCMRVILGLPALSTPAEVFAEVDTKLLPALIEQEALEATESGAADDSNMQDQNGSASVTPDGTQLGALTRGKNEAMDAKLLMTLATAFGIAATTEEAIVAAAQDAKTSRTQLVTLYKAMGATDENTAAVRLAALLKADKDWADLKPKYDAAMKRLEELDAKDAETEVTLALEQHKLPEAMKPVLLDYRKRNVEEFRKQFPVTAADKQHLSRSLFATNDGAQLGSQKTGANQSANGLGGESDLSSTVEAYPGRNRVEKCMAFIRGTVKGADKWTYEDVHAQACEMNRKLPRAVA